MSEDPNAAGHPVKSDEGENIKWSEMPALTRADVEKAYIEEKAKNAVTKGWPYPGHCDWLLARIVDWANHSGVTQDIIFTVKGTTISGTLMSGKDYFEAIALMTERGQRSDPSIDETLSIIASSYRDEKKHYERPDDAPEDYEAPPPGFIHLKNPVYIFGGNNSLTITGSFWRGRLSEVDGFILGTYNPRS